MFWLTSDTVKQLYGETYKAWNLFGPVHLFWLILSLILVFISFKYYPKLNKEKKRKILIILTILLIIDELFKDIPSLITHQFVFENLPFHLCSVNIFICLLNTIKENKCTKLILTTLCIPAALCALVMPTWTRLPILNFMHIHSETIHIMLLLYPVLLLADGYRPSFKDFKIIVAYIISLAIIDKIINYFLGTNFLFLTHNENNPALMLLENLTGPFYNLGIVIFILLMSIVMIYLLNINKRKNYD